MLPACGRERCCTIRRQVRGVLREASDDPAPARRNVTTQSALIRAADPQDVECLARAQRRHRPRWRGRTDRGSGSARRRGCGRRRFASGRRSAGTDRRDGAAPPFTASKASSVCGGGHTNLVGSSQSGGLRTAAIDGSNLVKLSRPRAANSAPSKCRATPAGRV
jgi:hypothetical protein